ncbi:hypothetical protein [Cohnella sp. REN36]|nr:hypothetical protein [Cohnella sp. REN36]
MPKPQGAPADRKNGAKAKPARQPESPGYDKKLDGPNRPST